MNKMLDAIMNKLLQRGFVNDENAEIVRFGLELIIMKAIISTAMIVVAVALKSVPEVLVFMAVYAPLRNNCGGYHSRSRIACFFSSIIILTAVITAIKLIQGRGSVFFAIAFLCTGTVLILTLAPVDTWTKPFDSVERVVFRRRSLIAAAAAFLISVALTLFGLQNLALSASCAVLMTGAMLAAGRLANKKGAVT